MTQDDTQPTREKTRRRRPAKPGPLRRTARLCAALASGALALVIVVCAGAYLRLASGPITLDGYLPEITAAISERLPGARLEVTRAEVALSDRGAELRLVDVTLIDEETGPIAHVPEAAGVFRPGDLLQGVVDPSDVILRGVSVELVRSPAGAFEFGFAGEAGGGREGVQAFRRLLAAATAEAESDEIADFTEEIPEARGQILQLADTKVYYDDRMSGRKFETTDASLLFWRADDGIYVNASLTLDSGRETPVTARMRGRRLENGDVELSASFQNAEPLDLADQIRALDWLSAFDAPVGGSIEVGFTAEGVLTALEGEFNGGAGQLRLADGVVEPVTSTHLAYVLEPESERFLISAVGIRSGRLKIDGEGFVQVNRDESGEPHDIVAQLDFSDIAVEAPEFLDAGLAYDEGKITGRLTLEPLTIEIGELRLARGPMRFNAAGVLNRHEGAWEADVTVEGRDFILADMLAHWPRQAAPGALLWMRENMRAAEITEADAIVRLGRAEGDEVKIDFTFRNAEGDYLAPMPPIRDADGAGQVDMNRFTLSLDRGRVTLPSGGELGLAGSSFVITDLNHPDTPAVATIVATGPTAAALALIDEEPLALTSKLGAPLDGVGGEAEVLAVADFPLLKDLPLEDVKVSAEAILTDFSILAPGLDRRIAGDRVTLVADTAGFEVKGDIALDGVPAATRWTERFDPPSREIEVSARITPERLASFGLEQAYFTGGAADVRATLDPQGEALRFAVEATLDGAVLAAPEIGWTKAEGQKASLTIKGGTDDKGRYDISGISLKSPDLAFEGGVLLTRKGAIARVRADAFRYRGAADMAFTLQRKPKVWRLDVDGKLLNLAAFEDVTGDLAKSDDGPRTGRRAFRAGVRLEELRLNDEQFFRNVEGNLAQETDGAVNVRLDGDLLGGGRVRFRYNRNDKGGEARVRAKDAGRFLRDAGIFDDGAGGELLIRARIPPGDALKLNGRVLVRDIVIHDDAKLEQMLVGADLDELRATMREDGIVFSSIRAPFSYNGDRIRFSEAVAKGDSIGVSISGDYQIESDTMKFDGVFTPLYALNSVLGKIPILGDVLTGGEGQGVFAFNFAVRGSAKDPKVSVNPLSILTPGVLRRVLQAPVESEVDEAFAAEDLEDSRR